MHDFSGLQLSWALCLFSVLSLSFSSLSRFLRPGGCSSSDTFLFSLTISLGSHLLSQKRSQDGNNRSLSCPLQLDQNSIWCFCSQDLRRIHQPVLVCVHHQWKNSTWVQSSKYTTRIEWVSEWAIRTLKGIARSRLQEQTYRITKSSGARPWPLPLLHQRQYQPIVRGLIYIIAPRPNIAFTPSRLSKFNAKPTTNHMESAKHSIWYLKHTNGSGLHYRGRDTELYGYTDCRQWALYQWICFSSQWCLCALTIETAITRRSVHWSTATANTSYEMSELRCWSLASTRNAILPHRQPYMPITKALWPAQSAQDSFPRSNHIEHTVSYYRRNTFQHYLTTAITADILTKALPRKSKNLSMLEIRSGFWPRANNFYHFDWWFYPPAKGFSMQLRFL